MFYTSLLLLPVVLALPWVEIQEVHQAERLPFISTEVEPFEQTWASFKVAHDKEYDSALEETYRKEIFRENLKKIEMHNYLADKGLKSYRLGINNFADWEHKEFVAKMNGYSNRNQTRPRGGTYMSPAGVALQLPDAVDWRDKGYVTDVKNQKQCGSCWSFSTTGALEGQMFRKTGKLVSLSEQNLVDCSKKWGNNGCNGGLMDYAFQYIKDNKGIDTEESYPYEARDAKCRYSDKNIGGQDIGFIDVPSGDESKLQEALATVGPVSVAIDASHQSFQLYSSGVYDEPDCSSEQLDHGVLAVGYGTKDGHDFWIVKNSWSTSWGDKGYIYMTRNKSNQCGVATAASYPQV